MAPQSRARQLTAAWFPLWISWLAMALEFPVIAACVARLPDPQIALAGFGGVIVPVAFIIESPIIMLLSASTALCQDRDAYRKLFRIMMVMGGALSALHLVVVTTPLYDIIVRSVLEIPEVVAAAAQTPLLLMVPWTWAIAYRRFHQGILIRFGKSSAVGIGTMVRLTVITSLGLLAVFYPGLPGAIVAAGALVSGVVAEAALIGVLAQPLIREHLSGVEIREPRLTYRGFMQFYYPLLLTSLLDFSVQPICSAALARMAHPIESLAALPIMQGISFMLRSPSFAISELVIAQQRDVEGTKLLFRGAHLLSLASFLMAVLLLATPLSDLLLKTGLGLDETLAAFAYTGVLMLFPVMVTAAYKSYFQGLLVGYRATIYVTRGTVTYLAILIAGLLWGISQSTYSGIAVMGGALSVSAVGQLLVLWAGSRNGSRSQ